MEIGRLSLGWARDDGMPRVVRCAAGCWIVSLGPLWIEWETRACAEQWDFDDNGKPIRPPRKGNARA